MRQDARRPSSRSVLRSIFVAIAMIAPLNSWAQAVIDPTTAEFTPSAEHDAVSNGVPIVSAYELGFYQIGASQPFQTMSLGKSTRDPDGKIRVVFTELMGTTPTPAIEYEARVSAVGPGGVAISDPSNRFSFSAPPPPCAYTVAPLVQSVDAAARNGSVSVKTAATCSWGASSNAAWIMITNPGP